MKKLEMRARIDDAGLWLLNAATRLRPRPRELRTLLASHASLRDSGSGRGCFVIGNGPSLKAQDLTRLAGEHSFVVNRFIHHPDAEKIRPRGYVLIDRKVETGAWGVGFLEEIRDRLPGIDLFVTPEIRIFLLQRGLFEPRQLHVIDPVLAFHFGFTGSWRPTGPMPCTTNVAKAAFFLAAHMGYNPITLVGVDGDGLLRSGDTHFYGRQHEPVNQIDLENDLIAMAMGLRGWRAIAAWARRQGIDVLYANPQGVIDTFPRVTLEDALARTRAAQGEETHAARAS